MKKFTWTAAAAAALAAVGLTTAAAFAYAGDPGRPAWAGTGTQPTAAQIQERQQQMVELHQQYGVPLGQPLMRADGTGPHGPGAAGSGNGVGPDNCPYRTAS